MWKALAIFSCFLVVAQGKRTFDSPDQLGDFSLSQPHVNPLLSWNSGSHLQEWSNTAGISDCVKCQLVLAVAAKYFDNSTEVAKIVAELKTKCQHIGLNGTWVSVCEDVAGALTKVLPVVGALIYKNPYSPFAWCSMVSICTVDCCDSPSTPEQVHLALTDDPASMSVSWVTQLPAQSIVQFGLSSKLGSMAVGTTRTYKEGGWNGTVHAAILRSLKPNTEYFYRVGDGANSWSEVFSFRTLSSNPQMLRFAVLGDMGLNNSNYTIAAMEQDVKDNKIDVVLHVGDISYADGYQHQWDVFMRRIQSISARVPYMVVPGNHEIAFDFASYKTRFEMPGLDYNFYADGIGNMFYSFNVPFAHIIGFSTESQIDTAFVDPMGKAFLQQDLQINNRTRASRPWLIGMGHRPLYCSGANGMDCKVFAGYLRDQLEDMFYEHKADLILHGHVHNYERMYPVYKGQAFPSYNNPKAPVYIVDGAAGNREGLEHHYVSPSPSWSAVRDAEFGYAHMVVNSTTLSWTYFAVKTGTIKDQFSITKSAPAN